ncbi:MAG: DUF4277 domain-containing protein, partial [Bdellovibrionales bacterium]|nr:DUF4277 domain-containing protein [Bdellovibrionales bacterium]
MWKVQITKIGFMERLRGVDLDMLNDDVLGRSLDAIHAYGPSKFFSDLVFSLLKINWSQNSLHGFDKPFIFRE